MDDLVKRLLPATLLLMVGLRASLAGTADDQYAVAAGHYAQGRWELAAEEFETFLDYHADHPRGVTATFFLAEALVQLKRYDEARANFDQVLSKDPDHQHARRALFRLGEAAYFAGDYPQAIVDLRRFRSDFPQDELNAYVGPRLADALLRTGDAEAAKQAFTESLEKHPQGPLRHDCRFGLAKAAQALGDDPLAARLFNEVADARNSPLADDARFEWAASLYEAGKFRDAVEAFDRLATDFPDSPWLAQATMAAGWALHQLKDYQSARQRFDALIDDDRLAMEARLWRGLAERAQGRWRQAAETFSAAVELHVEHELLPTLLYYAGDALLRGGEADQASAYYDRVLKDWPDCPWCDDSRLGNLNAAFEMEDHAQFDQLFLEFGRAHPESPLRADVLRLAAQSHLQRGQFARAAQMLTPVIEKTAAAEDRLLLARALGGQARFGDALAQLDIVLSEADGALQNDAKWARAVILLTQARHEEAIVAFKDILKDESNPQIALACRARLAVSYGRAGRWDEARVAYAEFEKSEPKSELLLPTARQLAEAAYAVSDYDWAGDLFSLLAAEVDDPDTAATGLSGLAWCRYQAGKLPEASDLFARLVAEHASHPSAARGALTRGTILERLGKPDAALASYLAVIEAHPSSDILPEAMLAAARLHVRLSQPTEAADVYRQLVDQHESWENADAAIYHWAWLLNDTDQPDQAAALFGRLHKDFRESRYWADATYRIAQQSLDKGETDRAEQLIAAVIQSDPADALLGHALFLESQVAASRGNWTGMEKPLTRLVETLPDHSARLSADYWLAEAAYRDGRHAEAGQRFAAIRQQTNGLDENWLAMVPLRQAQVLAHEKHWQDALRMAAEIEASYPTFPQQHEADYLIGRCHAAAGEFQQARESYGKVIRFPAADKTETQAMAQWMIGESFFHQKNYRTALREYLRVEILYAYPAWQAAALLQAAKCHEQLEEWKQAAELYARLIEQYAEQRFADEAARRLREAKRRVQTPSRS